MLSTYTCTTARARRVKRFNSNVNLIRCVFGFFVSVESLGALQSRRKYSLLNTDHFVSLHVLHCSSLVSRCMTPLCTSGETEFIRIKRK